ncbi:hypothetical protein VN97_g1409 [Penicillium thymicola]|uniref:Uncharacterized protein n=1 Tax=Penicillium thymicola TaxID=293382 RepID=A0AAI9TR12_PENTH|nr:hypothetical protein VN97_g1409 [Penicillium thymicola]
MPVNFSTLTSRTRQKAAHNLQARSEVIRVMNAVYTNVEKYRSAQINPDSYEFLRITFQPLQLDEDGKHAPHPDSGSSIPVFFEPRGAAWVAPVVTNTQYMDRRRDITERWDIIRGNPLVKDLHAQASYIFSCLEWMFFQFRRQFYPPEDGRAPPNLRQMSKWTESGDVIPSVVAEKLSAAIWGSTRCSPATMFVPKTQLYPSAVPPHVIFTILIGEEPSDELMRVEVMILTAVMITRLEGEESLEYNTTPVMVITLFGGMKARVIEAHTSEQGIVIKKTQLFDFSTNEAANKSMDTLLGFMCADLIGDPSEPTAPTAIFEIFNANPTHKERR